MRVPRIVETRRAASADFQKILKQSVPKSRHYQVKAQLGLAEWGGTRKGRPRWSEPGETICAPGHGCLVKRGSEQKKANRNMKTKVHCRDGISACACFDLKRVIWLPYFALGLSSLAATLVLKCAPAEAADPPVVGCQTIYSFVQEQVGMRPEGSLIVGSDGALYGTTSEGGGGLMCEGTVFRVNQDGSGFSYLKRFERPWGQRPTGQPVAQLLEASDGVLYGTTYHGTIFKLNKDGTGFTVLAVLNGSIYCRLVEGSDGALYGADPYGDTGYGCIFKLNKDGTGFTVLRSFVYPSEEGWELVAGLVEGAGGALFGVAAQSSSGWGTVFKISKDGTDFTVLKKFSRTGGDAKLPYAGVIEASDGNLYGTTSQGGAATNAGTVFRVSKDGSAFAVLKNFTRTSPDGASPQVSLLEASDGALYGTTPEGGSADLGTAFKLNKDGTGFAVLKDFTGIGSDGWYPHSALIRGRDGALYGTTVYGGDMGVGTVFRLDVGLGPLNIPPIANAGADQTVHPGTVVTLDGSGSSDPDGNYPLTYAWQIVSRPAGSAVELLNANTVTPTFVPDRLGDYTIQVIVTDSQGLQSQPDTVVISTFNTAPVADAGPDQALWFLHTTVRLDGARSYDDEGDPFVYQWAFVQKPPGSVAVLNGAASGTPAFVADVYGEYVIRLTVADIFGAVSAPDTVTVSFTNVKPVANADGNQAVVVGQIVLLNGSGSSDANRDPLTFIWSFVSKPANSQATLTAPAAVQTSFVPDLPGTYVVSLVVNDGLISSDPNNVTVEAITRQDAATQKLMELIGRINGLPTEGFKNENLRNALTSKINAALAMLENGAYAAVLNKLESDLLPKTDGCAIDGAPDANDWIKDCADQAEVYPVILEAIALIRPLL